MKQKKVAQVRKRVTTRLIELYRERKKHYPNNDVEYGSQNDLWKK